MLIVWPEGSGCVQKPEDLDPLKAIGTVEYHETPPKDKADLIARVENADVVFLDYSVMDAEVISRCKNLKFVCFLGIGYSNCIDVEAATKQGVTVAYTPGYGANSVAEFTLGLIIDVTRHIGFSYLSTVNGAWEPNKFLGIELKGKTLGLVGLGPIGMEMVRLGNAIGMDVIAWTRNPDDDRAKAGLRYVSLEELFSTSDVVSVHVSYNKETEGIVNRKLLRSMKPEAYFVNTARAGVIDSDALYELMKDGAIAGAALDVHEQEPAPADYRFLKLPNVLITPHTAYNTNEAGANMLRIAISTLTHFLDGKQLHVVN